VQVGDILLAVNGTGLEHIPVDAVRGMIVGPAVHKHPHLLDDSISLFCARHKKSGRDVCTLACIGASMKDVFYLDAVRL
jgi:hypothetical protein